MDRERPLGSGAEEAEVEASTEASASSGPGTHQLGPHQPDPHQPRQARSARLELGDVLRDELRAFGLRPMGFVRRPSQPPGFEVLHELSRGGQGIVYEAVQRSTGRRVALKVGLARELPGSDENERFRREVRLLASLHHTALPTVFESGVEEGWHWLAMEFVEGVDLVTWAGRTRPGRRRIVEVFARICEGVALAHRHGIVHRDLKPSNILIDTEGNPVVLDFGLAKQFRAEEETPDVTRQGAIVGSPLWLAPEQIHSPEDVDPRADVYALGRILYLLLSGAHPYAGDPSRSQWLRDVRDLDPLPLRRVAGREADPVLEAVVMKAVEREPARRYPDAEALREDCIAWLAGAATVARPDGAWARVGRIVRRRKRAFAALLVAALTLTAVGVGTWLSAPRRWEQSVHEALALAGSESMARLWELHLDAPSGVASLSAAEAGGVPGPRLTHDALLAKYLVEPCSTRVALPHPERTSHVLRSAPRGDLVVVRVAEPETDGHAFWYGRDPDYAWARLAGLEDVRDWQLSEDGRFLAVRSGVAEERRVWRVGELGAAGELQFRALPWTRELAPRELALAWWAGGRLADGPASTAVALIYDARSEWSLVRADDGAELRRLPRLAGLEVEPGQRLLAALDPEARWLAVSAGSGELLFVPLGEAPAPLRRMPCSSTPRALEFLDGATLALDTGGVQLVDLGEGAGGSTELGSQFLFGTDLRSIPVWLRDSRMVARGGTHEIQFLPRGALEPVVRWSTQALVQGLHTVANRSALLTHESDGHLARWDVGQDPGIVPPWRRLAEPGSRTPIQGATFGVAFSPDGQRVAVSHEKPPLVRVSSIRGPSRALEFTLLEDEGPNCLDWSRSGPDRVAIGGLFGGIYLWSPGDRGASGGRSDSPPVHYGELGGAAHAVALSPDGRHLVAGGQRSAEDSTGRIRIWRVGRPGSPVRTLESPDVGRITSLAFGAGGRWLAVGTANSDQLLWLEGSLDGELPTQSIRGPASSFVTRDVDVLRGGIVSGHRRGVVRYSRAGEPFVTSFDLGSQPYTVAAHPGGTLVAAGDENGRVHLLSFDGESFARLAVIPFPTTSGTPGTRQVFRVRFSPDGRYLVVGGGVETVPCYLDLADAERCLAGNLGWARELVAVDPNVSR